MPGVWESVRVPLPPPSPPPSPRLTRGRKVRTKSKKRKPSPEPEPAPQRFTTIQRPRPLFCVSVRVNERAMRANLSRLYMLCNTARKRSQEELPMPLALGAVYAVATSGARDAIKVVRMRKDGDRYVLKTVVEAEMTPHGLNIVGDYLARAVHGKDVFGRDILQVRMKYVDYWTALARATPALPTPPLDES